MRQQMKYSSVGNANVPEKDSQGVVIQGNNPKGAQMGGVAYAVLLVAEK